MCKKEKLRLNRHISPVLGSWESTLKMPVIYFSMVTPLHKRLESLLASWAPTVEFSMANLKLGVSAEDSVFPIVGSIFSPKCALPKFIHISVNSATIPPFAQAKYLGVIPFLIFSHTPYLIHQ